jgi:hypothetical protein
LLLKIRKTGAELDIATIASLGRSVPTVTMDESDTSAPAVSDVISPPRNLSDSRICRTKPNWLSKTRRTKPIRMSRRPVKSVEMGPESSESTRRKLTASPVESEPPAKRRAIPYLTGYWEAGIRTSWICRRSLISSECEPVDRGFTSRVVRPNTAPEERSSDRAGIGTRLARRLGLPKSRNRCDCPARTNEKTPPRASDVLDWVFARRRSGLCGRRVSLVGRLLVLVLFQPTNH